MASQDCPDSEPGERAAELETAVFNQNKGVNPKYKAKIRSLWVNLKDPKNPDFRASVLTGEVSGTLLLHTTLKTTHVTFYIITESENSAYSIEFDFLIGHLNSY